MSKVLDRKVQVLKLIVEEYLKTGEILGSKNLLKKHDLQVSSATVRNDMAALEQMGLIFQPYNSAGRLPTDRGLRVFVDYLMNTLPTVMIDREQDISTKKFDDERIDDQLYNLVSRLTKTTGEITFACIPKLRISKYLGFANHIARHQDTLSTDFLQIVSALENKYRFIDMLEWLDVSGRVGVFIGKENPLPELQWCTMLVKKIELGGYTGYLGIIGSTMMDYTFNIQALRQVL